jgi:hypothetical protein
LRGESDEDRGPGAIPAPIENHKNKYAYPVNKELAEK